MSDTTSRSGFGTGMATSVAESSFIKALSLADTATLVAGTMIGSGCFVGSYDTRDQVETSHRLIAIRAVRGVVGALSALAYGKCAAMLPTMSGRVMLRETHPHVEREYRAVGYPALPALSVLIALAVAVILLLVTETSSQALTGLLMVFIGIAPYLIWRGTAGNTARDTD